MVVNNWHVVMEGHVLVVGRAARVFFFAYYLVTVVVVSNVVIAFILDGTTLWHLDALRIALAAVYCHL
jgi:hypothetical protein